ncbi:MAG: hypothetical protein LBR20_08195 [Propionibacteriaceae bacterium]|jgi:hypothetical protein|nr:hypothetical protein [Propionibacteriaceae bacterium]
MVTNPAILKRLSDSAAGSVRAEGGAPSIEAQKAVADVFAGRKSPDVAMREVVNRYKAKPSR